MGKPIYIIAEAGVNHNGSLETALEMVQSAAKVGANAVKFQTFRADAIVTQSARKANYQSEATDPEESQYAMLKRFEFGREEFIAIKKACEVCDIDFLSTPFDLSSIDLLAEVGVQVWKIPSGEITNLPYLRKIGARNDHILLSTGMADLDEVGAALEALGQAGTVRSNITVLHCTTEYPTPMEEVNLQAMLTMNCAFPGLAGFGYSDHTEGVEVAVAAAALGATVVEKHFTLDRAMPGPDHRASLEPEELERLVRAVRNIEHALGDGKKCLQRSEAANREIVRKSIVATRPIKAGSTISESDVTTKRPGSGLSPMLWDHVVGSVAQRDYMEDECIDA